MPRRASLIMFMGFAVALVFVTGISAGAAQEGGVKAKEAEVASAQDRLMKIRMETSAAEAAYNNALYEMNQLNGKIAQATEDLDAAKERLAEAQTDLEERASQVYQSGNVAFMDVLVGVDDFSEFATRLDLWVRLLGEERAKVRAVEEAKDDLAARKRDLEDQRTKRVDAVDKAIAQKERAEEAERDAEAYLGSLNAKLRDALQAKQDRLAAAALAAAEELKAQKVKPVPAPAPEVKPVPAPAPAPDEPTPIPEVQVTQVKQIPVERPDLQDEQAAADRAAAAEAAAARAERLAESRAAERAAAREAAEQAAAEQAAAEKEAARLAASKEARQEARQAAQREAELAAQRAAERQAARQAAQREAELAAQRAAAERAAAQQAADEREAAKLAAQRRAELQEERRLAREEAAAAEAAASAAAAQEAQAAEEAAAEEALAAAEEAAASASASAAAQEEATRPPQQERPTQETTGSASASASATPAAPVGGGGASGSGSSVIAEGQKYLGTPYVLGGAESCVPYEMMDCSCFTMTVYSAFGIALPDSPGGQMGYGTPVSGAPMAGDLLFWSEDGSGYITHVGIAMGDGTAIHASTYTGNVTQGTPIDSIPGYAGARRLL